MVLLERKSGIERVASFLLEMDRRISQAKGGSLQLPMGRGDIADHLGMTTETVSRALAQLAQTASIKLTQRGIELFDRVSLRHQATA
jgi:CRP-like cAMP-binding protein